ncbi:hypothetical protein A3F32_03060 [Candidatus Roizmanbacteria bacterium RIFCSPHIGHO2_12_FULL_42_10]|uniref:Uncharacterized protein n=2 Tax=Candidatus Roizmaniibacteriota TaxID=1752723 RepID=A0A1F7I515_9BACT|nr:MAG: hypothetical protein A3D08_03715 [Candidatus Roizmanbacteria bacterium RIFCSPHIGHO2_02_FULL_43_11]OGK38352.1 MAG: hypothetical protein A3F32_03060 [Candidatus Roizmanbacteria bacterium RIFCSPHIGHO2_12_FULL_42_10]
MPRKTRKQKINAAKRRTEVPQLHTKVPHPAILNHIPPSHAPQAQVPVKEEVLVTPKTKDPLRAYTIRDVVKTVIVISVIFAGQVGIYLADKAGFRWSWWL